MDWLGPLNPLKRPAPAPARNSEWLAIPAVQFFAAFGALLSLNYIYRLINFIWIYFLKPSSIEKYLHGDAPYAIVTGASDGIGKALACELYDKGFNLILHGRNKVKTKRVVDEIRARPGVKKDVRFFLTDAQEPDQDYAKIVGAFRGLNITLVVHNAGGTPKHTFKLDGWSEEEIINGINLNAIFPTLFTRALLPQLRAAQGPTLVAFVGSISADIPMARFVIYAASKHFLEALARCLDADECYPTAAPQRPTFMYLSVGKVVSNSMRTVPSLFNPTSERFAKSVVARLACGRRRITPYMPHAVQQWFISMLGDTVVERAITQELKELLTLDDNKSD